MVVTASPRFSLDEFHRIAEVIPSQDLELIGGELRTVIAKGTRHSAVLDWLVAALYRLDLQGVRIRVEMPLSIPPDSEPQPDLALVRQEPTAYFDRHPQIEDTLLVIEVADSSLDYDLGEKRRFYQAAGLTAYWVVDAQRLELILLDQETALPKVREAIQRSLADLKRQIEQR